MSAVMHQHPQFQHPQPWTKDLYRKRLVFMMIVSYADWFRRDDLTWISANWHIWEAFEREALKIWDRGRTHYSARTIIEYLRHESEIRETPNAAPWKINDHYTPSLARLFTLMHPDKAGFFEKRSGQSAVRAL